MWQCRSGTCHSACTRGQLETMGEVGMWCITLYPGGGAQQGMLCLHEPTGWALPDRGETHYRVGLRHYQRKFCIIKPISCQHLQESALRISRTKSKTRTYIMVSATVNETSNGLPKFTASSIIPFWLDGQRITTASTFPCRFACGP